MSLFKSFSLRTFILELILQKIIIIVNDFFIIIHSSIFEYLLSVNRILYTGTKQGVLYRYMLL